MATPHVPATYAILTLAAARRQLNQLQKAHNPNLQKILALITSLRITRGPLAVGSSRIGLNFA